MESSTPLPGLPFKKKPRPGQARLLRVLGRRAEKLVAKLPTGYGKTYVGFCVYAVNQRIGKATRLLIITAGPDQSRQYVRDGHLEAVAACVSGPTKIMDVEFYALAPLLKAHRSGACQIYVIHIQALLTARGRQAVQALMETGQWMVWVDEHHHYGVGKPWGRSVLSLTRSFLLATSATPDRPEDDGVFGEPDVSVTYREAVEERALKPLRGHSYNYLIEFDVNGKTLKYTTKELAAEAGGDDPEKIEQYAIDREMRWKPDYISPLVARPIDRMVLARIATGYKLQALVKAMCVSHAKLICEQIRMMYPDLVVEWVGTGPNGRSDKENQDILDRFCPAKNEDGARPPSGIDVLVNVGMAGEAKDTITVSEIIVVDGGTLSNTLIQIIGRASRYLVGVVGHVNFDGSSGLAKGKYVGAAIMDAMEFASPRGDDDDGDDDDDDDEDDGYDPLPPEPATSVARLQLLDVDSGDEGVQVMAQALREHSPQSYDFEAMFGDQNHPAWQDMVRIYMGARRAQTAPMEEQASIAQLREYVGYALTAVTRLSLLKMGFGRRNPAPKALPGSIKGAINRAKKARFGEVCNDEQVLNSHYLWLKDLEGEILNGGLPAWLANLSR